MFTVQGVPQEYVQLDSFLAFACDLFFGFCLLTFLFFLVVLFETFHRKERLLDFFTPVFAHFSFWGPHLIGTSAFLINWKFINYLLMFFSLFFAKQRLSEIQQSVESRLKVFHKF